VLIPAAGAARRMRGADKLLEPVEGRPLLALLAARARAAGAPVLVTLAPGQHARAAALAGLDVTLAEVPEAAEGMAASLRAGAAALCAGGHDGLMVLPADMPEIEAEDIGGMIAAFAAQPAPAPILRATAADGRPGHPVILPVRLAAELDRLAGDTGARAVLRAHAAEVMAHPLPQARALTDLDTPEDWAEWRAARRR
jgi:CTP:molybdopterin cytidylyltransferase MocA